MDEKKPSKIVLYEMKDDTNTDPLLEDKTTEGYPENSPQPRNKIKTQKYSEEMIMLSLYLYRYAMTLACSYGWYVYLYLVCIFTFNSL